MIPTSSLRTSRCSRLTSWSGARSCTDSLQGADVRRHHRDCREPPEQAGVLRSDGGPDHPPAVLIGAPPNETAEFGIAQNLVEGGRETAGRTRLDEDSASVGKELG